LIKPILITIVTIYNNQNLEVDAVSQWSPGWQTE